MFWVYVIKNWTGDGHWAGLNLVVPTTFECQIITERVRSDVKSANMATLIFPSATNGLRVGHVGDSQQTPTCSDAPSSDGLAERPFQVRAALGMLEEGEEGGAEWASKARRPAIIN